MCCCDCLVKFGAVNDWLHIKYPHLNYHTYPLFGCSRFRLPCTSAVIVLFFANTRSCQGIHVTLQPSGNTACEGKCMTIGATMMVKEDDLEHHSCHMR